MRRILGLLALLAPLLAASPTLAAPVLSLDRVGPGVIGVGETTTFELRITAPTSVIGAFSLDIAFDPSVLMFVPAASLTAQFGTRLGDPLLEAIGLADASVPGFLHVDEVSLLSSADLDLLQHDGLGNLLSDFVLASLSFEATGTGLGALDFFAASVQFSDANGNSLAVPALGVPDAIRVVPEPGGPALVAAAMAALLLSRKRNPRANFGG